MKFGPDLSNFQPTFSAYEARALKPHGVTFAFIGRQANNEQFCYRQYGGLRAAGIHNIGEYLISLNGAWPTLFDQTRYVAIDVEPGSEFNTKQNIDIGLQWVRDQGREPLIYSSRWAWDALGLQAVKKYSAQGVKLWYASYDVVVSFDLTPDVGQVKGSRFGGWEHAVMHQYSASWNNAGVGELDMNACEDSLWDNPPSTWLDPRVLDARDILNSIIVEHS